MLLLCSDVSLAQFPYFDSYSVSGISSVSFKYKGSSRQGKAKTEVPPWIIGGGWKSYFFVDGSDTYIWSSPTPLTINRTINLKKEAIGPYNASKSYIHSPEYDSRIPVQNWKRVYHAIYSAVYFNHPTEGPVSLGFLHGENKNLVEGSITDRRARRYPNTIQKNMPINPADPRSYSGGKPFHEGWDAYNALISAAWIPNNKQTNWGQEFFKNELGPIVWPSTGYITKEGIKCTSGLTHPSSIIFDNYIYVFYSEDGPFGANIPHMEGRDKGIKVVRVPLKEALNPNSYKVYYKAPDGTESWNPSLPAGFTKENMLNFVAVQGPKASDIMNDQKKVSQEIRFSAAKVRNTNYFIGVEQYIDLSDSQKFKVALRFSFDLLHWTRRVLVVYAAGNWDVSKMNYPILLSKDGWSNTEVDIDNFYILGTEPGVKKFVNKIHLQAPVPVLRSFAMNRGNQVQVPENVILPNPCTIFFKLAYTVDTDADVEINIYNLSGQLLLTTTAGKRRGKYVEDFDVSTYPAGVYLVGIRVNTRYRIYKLVKG
jgi:hypothetical protein